MKVNEIRQKLQNRKKDELQELIVEMYKQIPKKMRETKEIDELIDNPDLFKTRKQNAKKTVQMPDFATVEDEVKNFINNAYKQNYVAPNRIVPKKERSQWRFTAKRLVDQLTTLAAQPQNAKASTAYLEELYKLLCYACGYYTFASDEPFHTIKIPQPDFFKRVISLKKQIEENPDRWIRESLLLIMENDIDFETLTGSLSEELLEILDNAPLKEKAVNIAENLVREKEADISKKEGKHVKYRDERYINDLVEMIVMTQSALGEYEEARTFFKKHHMARNDEVKLYILLKQVMAYQRVEDWVREYESAVQKGIQPRKSLQDMARYIKRGNKFPKYMF
ncbi:hypothetical protein HUG20_01740 [Salicibibacter cibi]|uniref:Uncharacterized protein n=1 Tax=Salicibibacter cibi TaxID=2743001 RepID=A0A7T7CE70_9BACI|nr:hypothetical protein [Salicibibacter cibi]QQK78749.1 hypothetical protein HUG20_01740 [Salicibibacter cibi]